MNGPDAQRCPSRFQGVHVGEVLGNERLDRAGRRGDAVDRDEQRLLQHRRKQFRDGFPGVVGHVDSPFIPDRLTAKCAEASLVGIS
jgi:hypothetical protein